MTLFFRILDNPYSLIWVMVAGWITLVIGMAWPEFSGSSLFQFGIQ